MTRMSLSYPGMGVCTVLLAASASIVPLLFPWSVGCSVWLPLVLLPELSQRDWWKSQEEQRSPESQQEALFSSSPLFCGKKTSASIVCLVRDWREKNAQVPLSAEAEQT